MRYMGGKQRQAKAIVHHVGRALSGYSHIYIEPFCGGMGSAAAVAHHLAPPVMVLSDSHQALITMWQAVMGGWLPTAPVDEDTYDLVRILKDPTDPLTAFCGFGMSFGGRWFEGYARDYRKHPLYGDECNRRLLVSKRNHLSGLTKKQGQLQSAGPIIDHCDYTHYTEWSGAVFYFDPPYINRKNPYGVNKSGFDHGAFWSWAADMSTRNRVLVTEFVAPDGWETLHDFGDTVVRHHSPATKGDGTSERIFRYTKGEQW